MSLLSEIKQRQLKSRKNKLTAEVTLLTTLIGEAAMIGKNDGNRETTDEEVVAVIKKFIKNNNELMNVADSKSEAYEIVKNENEFLTQYLPSQMTEEELYNMIQTYIDTFEENSPRLMGSIMKWLKESYAGQYDGRLASKIVKELLNGR